MEINNGNGVTVYDACRITGWTAQWIYDLCSRGTVRNTKKRLGKLVFIVIDKQSLLDYCVKVGRPVNGEAE